MFEKQLKKENTYTLTYRKAKRIITSDLSSETMEDEASGEKYRVLRRK